MGFRSRNTEWGFWRTISRIENANTIDPAMAWEITSRRISEAITASPEGVRDFLDSRHGRHFADDLAIVLSRGETMSNAIDAAITRWMDWRISPETSRETGIPPGLPYFTGLAGHFDIMAEIAD